MKYRIIIDTTIEAETEDEAVEKFSDSVCTGEVLDHMRIVGVEKS